MDTLPDRSVTHVGKVYCHLCREVQQLVLLVPLSPISVLLLLSTSKIYGLGGNDIIQGRPGNCKVFTGIGNNVLMSGAASTAQLYGGSGG